MRNRFGIGLGFGDSDLGCGKLCGKGGIRVDFAGCWAWGKGFERENLGV